MSEAQRSFAVARIGPGAWDHLKGYPKKLYREQIKKEPPTSQEQETTEDADAANQTTVDNK